MKRQGVKIILVEPYFDLEDAQRDRRETGAQGARHAALGRRREGDHRLLQALRLRHQAAGRGASRRRERRASMDLDDPPVPGGALRRQPDPDRHPRLPRRPRRRARRDLRRPLAGPDRRPRRDHRHAAALHRAGPARALGLLDRASASPSSARRSSRRPRPPGPHPAGGDHRHLPTRWPRRPRSWR